MAHPCQLSTDATKFSHRAVVYNDGRQHYCERCGEPLDHDNFSNIPKGYVAQPAKLQLPVDYFRQAPRTALLLDIAAMHHLPNEQRVVLYNIAFAHKGSWGL